MVLNDLADLVRIAVAVASETKGVPRCRDKLTQPTAWGQLISRVNGAVGH